MRAVLRAAASRLRRYEGSTRARLAIVAGVVTFAVLAGTGASFAYWTAATTATSSAKAATLSISTANFGSVAYTHGNELTAGIGSVSFTSTTNTASTQAMAVTATFGTAAAASLASIVNLTVWQLSAASCATGPGAAATVTGTWTSGAVITASVTAAAPTATFCVRSVLQSREAAAPLGSGASFTPRVSGALTIGNFVAATAATATATQDARYIYSAASVSRYFWNAVKPINTSGGTCMDVSGGGTGSGTQVISWGCKTTGIENQRWQFLAGPTAGYVEIKPQNAQALRVDGTAVTVTTDTNSTSQQWQLQLVSAGIYQIVSLANGYCLTAPAGTGDGAGNMTTAICDNRDRQKFNFVQDATAIQLTGLACTDTGTSRANWSVTYSWATSNDNGPYTVQARQSATSAWVNLATSATGASNAPVAYGSTPTTAPWAIGDYAVRVNDAGGNQVATTTVTVDRERSGGTIFNPTYTYFLRCS